MVSYIAGSVGTAVAGVSALPVDAGFRVAALVVCRTGAYYGYLN